MLYESTRIEAKMVTRFSFRRG